MRSSVIVAIFVIALLGLGLRSQSDSKFRAPARIHAQESKATKPPKNPKGPAAPEAEPPKPPEAPPAPAEAQPPKQPEGLIHRDAKPTKSSEPPKVLWSKEVSGDARTTSQAAHRSALEAAARAFGEYLKDKYPGFKWTPTLEFLLDDDIERGHKMVVEEQDEERRLADGEAPVLVQTKLKIELRESHEKAALQEDRKVRVESRLWQAGRGLGGLVIILFAIVGYVRMDDWTKGYLSFPLKLTALAVAVAGPAALWLLV
jgi:type IV secretory pathway VirB10-like protein